MLVHVWLINYTRFVSCENNSAKVLPYILIWRHLNSTNPVAAAIAIYALVAVEYLYSITFNVLKNTLLFAKNKRTEHVYFFQSLSTQGSPPKSQSQFKVPPILFTRTYSVLVFLCHVHRLILNASSRWKQRIYAKLLRHVLSARHLGCSSQSFPTYPMRACILIIFSILLHVPMHTCVQAHIHGCTCANMYICICVCPDACMHTYAFIVG